MVSFNNASLTGTKYLTLEQASSEFGVSLPELKRSAALKYIQSVEIGDAVFVERESLSEYLSIKRSPILPTREAEEDETNQRPAIFEDAIGRNKETKHTLSVAPFMSTLLFLFIACILAFPTIYTTQVVEKNITLTDVKDTMQESLVSLFSHTEETTKSNDMNIGRALTRETSGQTQQAQVSNSFSGSIIAIVDTASLWVYNAVQILLGR